MRRIISFLLALACAFMLVGCSGVCSLPAETDPVEMSGGGEVQKEPPTLTIVCGEDSQAVRSGNYSWNYDNGDGTDSSVIACGFHPLQGRVHLEPFAASESTIRLEFGSAPDEITVWCWSDANWDNVEAASEPAAVDNGSLELKSGGYIYEVIAKWSGDGRSGTASYAFYAVYDTHTHELAVEPSLCAEPVDWYCGNTVTTVYIGGEEYSFWGSDSVNLTDILINLAYDPEKVCRCMVEFSVDTEFGSGYGVSLTEGFARCDEGQAELTAKQVQIIEDIISRLK